MTQRTCSPSAKTGEITYGFLYPNSYYPMALVLRRTPRKRAIPRPVQRLHPRSPIRLPRNSLPSAQGTRQPHPALEDYGVCLHRNLTLKQINPYRSRQFFTIFIHRLSSVVPAPLVIASCVLDKPERYRITHYLCQICPCRLTHGRGFLFFS